MAEVKQHESVWGIDFYIGHASVHLDTQSGLMTSLSCPPCDRGKNYGARLMRAAQTWSRTNNKRIYFWAGPFGQKPMTLERLCRFYEKLGFRFFEMKDKVPWYEFIP